MRSLLCALITPCAGLLLVIMGFLYDVAFAGIPYQDPTPAMQARYELNQKIAQGAMGMGLVLIILGLGLGLRVLLLLKDRVSKGEDSAGNQV